MATRRCQAVWAYEAKEPQELSFKVNDVITILKEEKNGWWKGELNGTAGEFPINYCEMMGEDSGFVSPSVSSDLNLRVDPEKVSSSIMNLQRRCGFILDGSVETEAPSNPANTMDELQKRVGSEGYSILEGKLRDLRDLQLSLPGKSSPTEKPPSEDASPAPDDQASTKAGKKKKSQSLTKASGKKMKAKEEEPKRTISEMFSPRSAIVKGGSGSDIVMERKAGTDPSNLLVSDSGSDTSIEFESSGDEHAVPTSPKKGLRFVLPSEKSPSATPSPPRDRNKIKEQPARPTPAAASVNKPIVPADSSLTNSRLLKRRQKHKSASLGLDLQKLLAKEKASHKAIMKHANSMGVGQGSMIIVSPKSSAASEKSKKSFFDDMDVKFSGDAVPPAVGTTKSKSHSFDNTTRATISNDSSPSPPNTPPTVAVKQKPLTRDAMKVRKRWIKKLRKVKNFPPPFLNPNCWDFSAEREMYYFKYKGFCSDKCMDRAAKYITCGSFFRI